MNDYDKIQKEIKLRHTIGFIIIIIFDAVFLGCLFYGLGWYENDYSYRLFKIL